MREQLHAVDQDCVRLVEDVRGGTLVDADDLARRLVALEVRIEARRDEVVLWRAYMFPPETRVGRLLYRVGEALIASARRVG
jgi:hypothetical protein